MVRVPRSYDHWRCLDATGRDRLYPSVRHIRGSKPWDSVTLIENTADFVRSEANPRPNGREAASAG
jgi:hypothetical protein